MAMPFTTSTIVPKTQIEAIQTVPPYIATDPREVWAVSSKESWIFRGTLNMVLVYKKGMEEDSGWVVAGWIKESLSRVLKEQPMLSGRLRRGEDGHGDLELVSNDSGTRLVEAKIDISLQDFLDFTDIKKAEAQLVFWKDIDEQNPQFSPLFYVQVTNFQCGGYSIGISCSLLLADALVDNFLQKWSNIQNDILSKHNQPKLPIFYLPNLKPPTLALNAPITSPTAHQFTQTMLFEITTENLGFKDNVALFCLEEAGKQLGTKISSEFSFLVKESPHQFIKVQNCKKIDIPKSHFKNEVKSSSSLKDYLSINEIAFEPGNRPVTVYHWIGSVDNDLVIEIPSPNQGNSNFKYIVSIPYENEI